MVDKKAEPKKKAVQEKNVKKASTGAWWKSTAKKETEKKVSVKAPVKKESSVAEKKLPLNHARKLLRKKALQNRELLVKSQSQGRNRSAKAVVKIRKRDRAVRDLY